MAADNDTLQGLHAAVAKALADAISPTTNEEGMVLPASAAHLSVAIAFLKNNNITASANTNKELADLSEALAARRRKKEVPKLALVEAEEALAKSLGYGGMQ